MITKKDIPQYGPDERQAKFFAKITKMRKKNPKADIHPVNIDQGFYASYVNLGWLQDRLTELVKGGKIPNKKTMKKVIHLCLQRVTSFDIEDRETSWSIRIMTQDDFGTYGFSLMVQK